MVLRLFVSLAGVGLVAKLLDENRVLRMERDEAVFHLRRYQADLYRDKEEDLDGSAAAAGGVSSSAAVGKWDEVDEASDESFPASDPPSFNGLR